MATLKGMSMRSFEASKKATELISSDGLLQFAYVMTPMKSGRDFVLEPSPKNTAARAKRRRNHIAERELFQPLIGCKTRINLHHGQRMQVGTNSGLQSS